MSYYNTHLNYYKTLYNFDNHLSSKSEFEYYYIMCINHFDIQDNFDLCILLFNYYDKYIFFFKVKKDLDHYKMKSKKKKMIMMIIMKLPLHFRLLLISFTI